MNENTRYVLITLIIFGFFWFCVFGIWSSSCKYYEKLKSINRHELKINFGGRKNETLSYEIHEE